MLEPPRSTSAQILMAIGETADKEFQILYTINKISCPLFIAVFRNQKISLQEVTF